MVRAREPSRGFAMRPSRIDMHLGKGGTSDASERMQDIIRTEADIGALMCIRLLDWRCGWRGGDCALTGGDEIEAREQHLNARAPLNCWEWDARPNLLERDGG